MLSIGQLANRTGVKIPTIRYYEKLGLIQPPHRSQGNQRRYEPDALKRLSFIKHSRDLGIKIKAIHELIDLSEDPQKPCAEADRIAREHLSDVQNKIASLQLLEKELKRIVAGCGGETVENCYVIQALANHELCADEH